MALQALVTILNVFNHRNSRTPKSMIPFAANIARRSCTRSITPSTIHLTYVDQILYSSRQSLFIKLFLNTCHVIYNQTFSVKIKFLSSTVAQKWTNKILASYLAKITCFFVRIVNLSKSRKCTIMQN